MIQSSITNSRLCNYNCNTLIYWNSGKKSFVEVETGNKHFCQARKPTTGVNKDFMHHSNTIRKDFTGNSSTQQYRPTFTTGSGKPWQQQKQPTKNSIQVLKGSELEVQKQYEKLSDIVVGELGGKIHGSQSHYLNEELRIIVYYEVPVGTGASGADNRELVKQRLQKSLV